MRKRFDRTIEGEGWLIRRDKAERERKKSDFWGCNWNEVYIVYCDGASFGGMMMMGILFSRSVDVHVDKCLHFCRGVPKLCGVRSSVYRHTVKGILMTISPFWPRPTRAF